MTDTGHQPPAPRVARYSIICTSGAITTVEFRIDLFARSMADAFNLCRERGYTPVRAL